MQRLMQTDHAHLRTASDNTQWKQLQMTTAKIYIMPLINALLLTKSQSKKAISQINFVLNTVRWIHWPHTS